jgi:hypothetical protein
MNRKGQVAIWIILAVLIIAGVILYLVFRGESGQVEQVPAELAPVYDFYLSCIESELGAAIELAGSQGGYVDVPNYIPGSEYAPFSSHLNFLGFPIPYWYYVSGNGLIKEQVPSKSDIEGQFSNYIEEGLAFCDFESFYLQGFEIEAEDPIVKVEILDGKVNVEVSADLVVSKDTESAKRTRHKVDVNSKFGKFYNLALEIYQEERDQAFLENYAVDVLYMYAPVDGVNIQCGPSIWSTENVIKDLKGGLEENIRTIKFDGDYYVLSEDKREYFVWDKEVDEAVNILYSRNWPTRVEVSGEGVDGEIMISEPVGTQEGMGAMGFCYVPYHFVYDVSFPALIQIYDSNEIFQFPIAVIIDNNVAREAIFSQNLGEDEEFNLCEYEVQTIEVNMFNINLEKVDANITYECFDQRCRLGESEDGKLVAQAPACVNGYLHLRTDGYVDEKYQFSTNSNSVANVILEREYELEVELKIDGKDLDGTAIVTFDRDDGKGSTLALPTDDKIKLSEGNYDVSVHVYGDSAIVIPATSKTECVEVPRGGLLGFFGSTNEECFDINLPETKIDYALIAGGKLTTYLLEDELDNGKVILSVSSFPKPTSIDGLQQNFEFLEVNKINLEFE